MRKTLIAVTAVLFTFAAAGFAMADPCSCQGASSKATVQAQPTPFPERPINLP